MQDRREYYRKYHIGRHERRDEIKKEWRSRNGAREKAHDRLRYLRSKENPSDGEIEQMIELAMRFPKLREVFS